MAKGTRWGKAHKDHLFECFSSGILPPIRKGGSKESTDSILETLRAPEHRIVHPFLSRQYGGFQNSNSKLLNHYRKAASAYLQNDALTGARRKRNDESESDDDDEEEEVDEQESVGEEEEEEEEVTMAPTKKLAAKSATPKKSLSTEVDHVTKQLREVDIAEGRVPGIPTEDLIVGDGLWLLYWTWTEHGQRYVEFEIQCPVDHDGAMEAFVSPDGKFFTFKAPIQKRFLNPDNNYTLRDLFPEEDLPDTHSRMEGKIQLLKTIFEKNRRDWNSEGLKRSITVPLPFVCKRQLFDIYAPMELSRRAYTQMLMLELPGVTLHDQVIRAVCVCAAEPVMADHEVAPTPNFFRKGRMLSPEDVTAAAVAATMNMPDGDGDATMGAAGGGKSGKSSLPHVLSDGL